MTILGYTWLMRYISLLILTLLTSNSYSSDAGSLRCDYWVKDVGFENRMELVSNVDHQVYQWLLDYFKSKRVKTPQYLISLTINGCERAGYRQIRDMAEDVFDGTRLLAE